MLAKDGRYFGRLLNGYQGVTQGHFLSSTIFNMVVGVVIRHWVRVVTPSEEIAGGLGLTIIDLATYFYADNGLMASTQLERLQRKFDVLAGLFDRVVLRKNTTKTVGMVCQPCHAPGRGLEEAYARWVTGKSKMYQERQWRLLE